MAREEEVILKVSADTSNLDRSIEASEDAVKNLGTTGQTVVGGLDKLTGGLASKFVGAAKGVGTFIKGLNLTKVAIAGTGIGLLVLALGSIVTYFTQSFEGARKLKTALAGVGAAVDVVVDRVSKFGESVVKFFSGDREGAVKAFTEATADLGDELEREIRLAKELETRRQALTDAQREQLVTTAKERSDIKALNLIAEDTTKNINDRIAAADEAGAKERALFEQRKANAEEELAIIIAQNELADSGEEDRQRQAELEAEVFNLAAESLEMQTTLQNKLNTLRSEGLRLRQEEEEAERLRLEAQTAFRLQEIEEELAMLEQEEEMLSESADIAMSGFRRDQEIEQAKRDEFKKTNDELDKLLDDKIQKNQETNDLIAESDLLLAQKQKALRDSKFEMAFAALGALRDLNKAFTGETEAEQRRSFERNKRFSIAQAIITTAQAVAGQLAVPKDQLTGANFVKAAIAAATGVAQIATIKKTKFGSGSTPPSPGNRGGGGTGAIPPSPQLDLGFLGAGAGQAGFRSYVIASEVSNSQQANQRINDQASLVG
jgi:hypothetical protein